MYNYRDGYRDQIVNMNVESSDVGLSLHSKMHQCLTLFPVLFLQSLYVPLNSENFSIYLSPHFLYLVPPYLVRILIRSSILVVTGLT